MTEQGGGPEMQYLLGTAQAWWEQENSARGQSTVGGLVPLMLSLEDERKGGVQC